jgi:hypothetical protein
MFDSHDDSVGNNESCYGKFKVCMINKSKEITIYAGWFQLFSSKLFTLSYPLDFNITSLVFCNKHVSEIFSLFNRIEIVNNNSNKQINNELTTNYHKCHKIKDDVHLIILFGLHILSNSIYSIVHNIYPAFSSCHLKQCGHCI